MARPSSEAKALAKPTPRIVYRLIILLAIIIFGGSGWAWWHYIHSEPQQVFEGMISNSLSTRGLAKRVQQSSGNQGLDERVELMTSPYNLAHSQTVLSQTGDNTAAITTETIGTPFTDYVRYLDIISNQKDANGHPIDFSKIKNIWGKTSASDDKTHTSGELFNETILGVVPVGDLPVAQRQALLKQIIDENVFTVDYSNVSRGIKNGRPTYVYSVTVKPEPYVHMLKTFAKDIGLTQLDTVDPANYHDSSPLEFKLTVDVWTHQLRAVNYITADRQEVLGSFGIQRPVAIPSQTISIDALQAKVQQIE